MPQGVLEVETLSSGAGGGRESQGELGVQGGAAATLGHRHLYSTFTHWTEGVKTIKNFKNLVRNFSSQLLNC